MCNTQNLLQSRPFFADNRDRLEIYIFKCDFSPSDYSTEGPPFHLPTKFTAKSASETLIADNGDMIEIYMCKCDFGSSTCPWLLDSGARYICRRGAHLTHLWIHAKTTHFLYNLPPCLVAIDPRRKRGKHFVANESIHLSRFYFLPKAIHCMKWYGRFWSCNANIGLNVELAWLEAQYFI